MAALARIRVTGEDEFAALARRLKAAGRGGLQRKLTSKIRKTGQPALRATRRAWRTVDVTSSRGGGSSSGLRARVASATKLSVIGSGIRIEVEPDQVDARYGKTLTYGLNGMGRWRHPVFGNTNAWQQQYGQEVFYKTIDRYEATWRRGVEEAMDEIAAMIEG